MWSRGAPPWGSSWISLQNKGSAAVVKLDNIDAFQQFENKALMPSYLKVRKLREREASQTASELRVNCERNSERDTSRLRANPERTASQEAVS